MTRRFRKAKNREEHHSTTDMHARPLTAACPIAQLTTARCGRRVPSPTAYGRARLLPSLGSLHRRRFADGQFGLKVRFDDAQGFFEHLELFGPQTAAGDGPYLAADRDDLGPDRLGLLRGPN